MKKFPILSKIKSLNDSIAKINSPVELLSPSSINTTVTEYSLSDAFANYPLLCFNLKYQGIFLQSIVLTSSMFNSLIDSSTSIHLVSGDTTIEIYKKNTSSIYMAASSATSNLRVQVIGFA